MALDAVCLSAVLEELRPTLEGGKIDKIYQPSREEILLAVRGAGENVKLLLSASPNGPRLHLTREVRENPAQPPMFCMLLRKHLTGGRILALEQPHLERIVLIRMETIDELGDRVPRTLVLEAMGRRANLILLDGEGRILDCVRRVAGDVSTGQRAVMPGMFYRLPEPRPGLSPLLERELDFRSNGESRTESLEQKLSRLEAKLKQENREARRRIDLNLDISPARARPSKREREGRGVGNARDGAFTAPRGHRSARCVGRAPPGGQEGNCRVAHAR